MGISGAMRRDELTKMSIDDIRDENSVLIVTVPDANTGVKRTFTVTNPEFLRLYHKYAALRPKHAANRRVFYRYKNGKCNAQVVGVHKIGEIPSLIAKYLGLPNSKDYTGHCFRRSSATLLANSGYV
jgi:integrase